MIVLGRRALRLRSPSMRILAAPARLALVGAVALTGCSRPDPDQATQRAAIGRVLDDFHDAAAKADEARYFDHFNKRGVFLGTDATERWDVAAFRAWAHPHFEKGKAWSFKSTRRAILVAEDGHTAWFDEDLATEKLGPARGSGVLVRDLSSGAWSIAQYNLALTIPNERFDAVRQALEGTVPAKAAPPPAQGATP